jgi:hypothetical protein
MMTKNRSKSLGRLALIGCLALALPLAANAQGTLFVENDMVGIGIPTPSQPLHVIGAALIQRTDGSSPNILFQDANQDYRFLLSAGNGAFNIFHATSGATPIRVFPNNATSTMVLRNSNVGLGVANPSSPIQHSNGAILSAGGVWTDASSRELKQNIEELGTDEALAALEDLNPVKFAYKRQSDEQYVGFIAEDVPDLVATESRKTLSSMDIVAVLTKVVQEQQDVISDLAEREAELQRRLEALEAQR